jgi:hypothetical protein
VHERGGKVGQVGVRIAPRQVRVLVVGGPAEDDRVTVGEVLGVLAELDDLGRTDEREVLRVGVEDQPLAVKVLVRDLLELLAFCAANICGEIEIGELIANGQHTFYFSPFDFLREPFTIPRITTW